MWNMMKNPIDTFVSRYINIIDKLLASEDYDYAMDFLLSVKSYIKKNNCITEKQKTAVQNIKANPHINFNEYEDPEDAERGFDFGWF